MAIQHQSRRLFNVLFREKCGPADPPTGSVRQGSGVWNWIAFQATKVLSANSRAKWTIQDLSGGYYKVINRANDLCLDPGGATANGAIMEFWSSGGSGSSCRNLETM